jgi:Na+-driven multidrug efflux pump
MVNIHIVVRSAFLDKSHAFVCRLNASISFRQFSTLHQRERSLSNSKKRDLTKGPTWKALTAMSAPMKLGIFSVIAVGFADAYFLGKLSGAALAAVGFIYPAITAITSLSIGLSAGANAAVSQYIRAGNNGDDINRIGLHAISLGLILSLALNPLFIFGWGPIPEMGTSGAAFATMVGRFVAVIIALWIGWRRGLLGVCGNI